MAKTVVALYDDRSTAQQVLDELKSSGFTTDHIYFTSHEEGPRSAFERSPEELATPDTLTKYGVPREEADFYAEGVRRGGSLILVRARDNDAQMAVDVMARRAPIRYEDRMQQYRQSGFAGYDGSSRPFTSDEMRSERDRHADEARTRFQEVEEHLKVGKRDVVTGGVRIHQRVETEREETSVRLRDEQVSVDRQPVDRTLSPEEADRAFRDNTIEVKEHHEEPVVQKEARVTGEVRVNKEVNERKETVGGEVRRTHVDVEEIDDERTRDRHN